MQGNEIVHLRRHLVGAQKAKREREDEKVVEQYAQGEHHVAATHYAIGVFPFPGVKGGRDEAEQHIYYIGGSADDAHVQGGLHVDQELLRQARIDELDAKWRYAAEIGKQAEANIVKPSESDEIRLLRGQQQCEDLLFQ